MDRRLGRPLPHQLPNPTRADPSPINLSHHLHEGVSGITPSFPGLFRRKGHVPTRYSPVRRSGPKASLDLHVLSLPPAFVLSQDQTLKLKAALEGAFLTAEPLHIVRPPRGAGPKRHRLSCIRPLAETRHPTNGEADTPIIGSPLMSRYANVRPSIMNQTARISLHHHQNVKERRNTNNPSRHTLSATSCPNP